MRLGPLAPIGGQTISRPLVIESEQFKLGRFVRRPYRVSLSQHPLGLSALAARHLKNWCERQWPSTWYRSEWSFDSYSDTFEFRTNEQRFHFVIRWRGCDIRKEMDGPPETP
ncbi:MAG: hypothetical protein EOP84_01735 [Verrucomicrobiaceae bacterium]|nr:MAG: hypothetical protein EOP84_01735 [Verrucomicrobiaceae bacterium]